MRASHISLNLSTFLPTQIAGLIGWWDATQISGGTDGMALSTWPDMSGSGNNMTQTGTNRPTLYTTTSAKLVNSKPAVWFVAANTQWMHTASVIFTGATGFSMFAVYARTAIPTSVGVLHNGDGGTNGLGVGYRSGYWSWLVGGLAWEQSSYAYDTSVHQETLTRPTTGSFRVDGTARSTGDATPNTPTGNTKLGSHDGGTSLHDGPICEALFYNSTLSTTNITKVEAYLKKKWGTP